MSQSDYLAMLEMKRRIAELERLVAELQESKADRAGRKPGTKGAQDEAA